MCLWGAPTILISRDREVVAVPGGVSHFVNRETEVQRGAVSGLRPHNRSVAELGSEARAFAFQSVCPWLCDTPP